MRAIFDNRAEIPHRFLPINLLSPFNLYRELEQNPTFSDVLTEVLSHNNLGNFASKGRTPEEMSQHILYGLAAEAWMLIHGAKPDLRKFRDSFIERDGNLVPIDVKTIESKYTSAWKTLEVMSEKVLFNTHECSDLEELYIWKYYHDEHPTRPGDLEFWKAYRRLDRPLH